MTAKQRVLKKFPRAQCVADCALDLGKGGMVFYDFAIWSDKAPRGRVLGDGTNARQAWHIAASNL